MKQFYSTQFILLAVFWTFGETSWAQTSKFEAPLFDNLGSHQLKISTQNTDAQRFFNQGLILSYGFNHVEAARSFREAIRLDPECAMCYWGLALVLGPNINATMSPTDLPEAYKAAQMALAKAENASDWEKLLIEAIAKRYPETPTDDRKPYDQQYADAIKFAYKTFPLHADITALYAEALMDLTPWDYWQKNGDPQPRTPEIVEVIEKGLMAAPKNPGLNHLYIHATEASKTPEKALGSAKLLENLVPGAGHLVHMPSHTYIRVGMYHEGTLVNEKAALADSLYITNCRAQGLYPLAYFPHNYHFMAATAALEGNSQKAILAASHVNQHTDHEAMKMEGMGTLQHYTTIPYYVLTKFARWGDILEMPMPEDELYYPQAVLHYARGMAYANQESLAQAENELAAIRTLNENHDFSKMTIWDINSVQDLVDISMLTLEAEIMRTKGRHAIAIDLLKKAVEIEDNLNYNEPPDWFFSIRHALGSVLLDAGQYMDAQVIFEEDLQNYPENGWALNGLQTALSKMGKKREAKIIQGRFNLAWQWADTKLDGARAIVGDGTQPVVQRHEKH
jgi:tetratricopeptide (TPR) repeat protein